MLKRLSLVENGLFPETLPPCFTSSDSKRAFKGIIRELESRKFVNRTSNYVRYNGTKHDGNRRYFGTPNIVSYFYVSGFIHRHWKDFHKRFTESRFLIYPPNILPEGSERTIKVASLSELSRGATINLGYAPVILKTDISQFYHSLYTHTFSWSRHGKSESKHDRSEKSSKIYFNALDFFTSNCQLGQTRGVIVGPDAFRLVAEYISAGIDIELNSASGGMIIGAVRHVDDYYIGVKDEIDAKIVLGHLRDILASYELQLNDAKTVIYSNYMPMNDLWAQDVRNRLEDLNAIDQEYLEYVIDFCLSLAREIKSDSPVKMLLRTLDRIKIYNSHNWEFAEKYLQRIVQFHSHALDYACLLVVKCYAIHGHIDREGWKKVAELLLPKHISYNNHHEIAWLFWLMICCRIDISEQLEDALVGVRNGHIGAMMVSAYGSGLIPRKPRIKFQNKLRSHTEDWLLHLVSRSSGFTKAAFGGDFSDEFEFLAKRKIILLDFSEYLKRMTSKKAKAISRVRYGYDDNDFYDDGEYEEEEEDYSSNPF